MRLLDRQKGRVFGARGLVAGAMLITIIALLLFALIDPPAFGIAGLRL